MDQVMSQDSLSEFAVSNSHVTLVPQNNTSLFLMPSLQPSHPSLAFAVQHSHSCTWNAGPSIFMLHGCQSRQ